MTKKPLSELKQAAMSAVVHPELVGFARCNSPTQASQLAQSNDWPERQRKSCVALAQLRRDYGEDEFNAFVNEHARSASAETEPVHKPKETVTMNDQQKSRVIELAAQAKTFLFQIMTLLRHGYHQEVVQLVMECLETGTILFWENDTEALGIDGEKKRIHSPILLFCRASRQHSDKLVHDRGDVCRLEFEGFNAYLNEDQRQAMCKKVLETMKGFKGYLWFFEGLCSVVDIIGTEEQKQEALWIYLQHRAESKEFARMGYRLGLKKESFCDSLPLVEKLLNDLGKTPQEICDIFDSWIALVAWSNDLPVLQKADC